MARPYQFRIRDLFVWTSGACGVALIAAQFDWANDFWVNCLALVFVSCGAVVAIGCGYALTSGLRRAARQLPNEAVASADAVRPKRTSDRVKLSPPTRRQIIPFRW